MQGEHFYVHFYCEGQLRLKDVIVKLINRRLLVNQA